jgi:hypothetical protein
VQSKHQGIYCSPSSCPNPLFFYQFLWCSQNGHHIY